MFNKYPYTDFHEINLDWIIREIKKLHQSYDDFKAVNTITNAGAWDITKQYSPWTVVSDNNAGYISLKPVPVGVDIHNTEYWGLIADYDILITDLSSRISDLENDMADVQGDIVTINSAISTINSNIHNLVNKKYIFISDSYGYHPSVPNSWINLTISKLGLSAGDYYSWYEGSTGFIHAGLNGHTFKTLCEANESAVSNPQYITDVILCGGTNDVYYASQYTLSGLLTAAKEFATYIKTTYPNATLHLGMCGNFINKDSTQRQALNAMPWIYETAAASVGGTYIDNIQYVMHIYDLFDDAQHPNASGSDMLSDCVVAHLKGGSYTVEGQNNGVFEAYPGNVISSSNAYYFHVVNDITEIVLSPGAYTIDAVTTPVNVPFMKFNPRKFGCPDTSRTMINGMAMNAFTTPIPLKYTFEITDPNASDGGLVYITSSVSAVQMDSGAAPYIGVSIPTISF